MTRPTTIERVSGASRDAGLQEQLDAAWAAALSTKASGPSIAVALDDDAEEIRAAFVNPLFDWEEMRQSEADALTQATMLAMERYFAASTAAAEAYRVDLQATIIDFMAKYPDAPLCDIASITRHVHHQIALGLAYRVVT